MRPEPDSAIAGERSLEEVVDCYLEEVAAGREPDPEAYCRQNPRLADALRGVFRTLEFIETTSRSLDLGDLERNQRLGEFCIVRELGRGGMGVVYEAEQLPLGRRVALKVLPAGAMLVGNARDRFLREAATAGRLHHSNIVPVFSVGEASGIQYYAMQYIEGRSLDQCVKDLRNARARPSSDWFRRVARIGLQVAEALGYAHDQGIVHRDVKPSNLLLDDRDNVWLSDFGLARSNIGSSLTLSGDVVGTARYMSPEQASGRARVDGRTDLYALGVTLYELLALRPAFEGESRDQLLNSILNSRPPSLRGLDQGIPVDLATIIQKCMEKEPRLRYQQGSDLAEDLRRFLDGRPVLARRPSALVKTLRFLRRHPVHTVGSLGSLLLASAALILVLELRSLRGERLLDEAFDHVVIELDAEKADSLLDQAESIGATGARVALIRGLVPLLSGRPGDAVPQLEKALVAAPSSAEAVHALAYAHFATFDPAAGHALLRRADELSVGTALGWLLRGYSLGLLERSSEEILCYDRAIELRRDFTPAIEARGLARAPQLLVDGNASCLRPMQADFDALVVFRPTAARSHAARASGHWVAAAHLRMRGADQAADRQLELCRADFERALSLRTAGDYGVLARFGAFLRFVGELEAAEQLLEQARQVAGDSVGKVPPGLCHQLAVTLHMKGDLTGALEQLDPACADQVCPFPLAFQHVMLLAEQSRLDEARRSAARLLQENSSDPSSADLARGLLALLGRAPAGWQPPAAEGATPGERSSNAFLVALDRFGAADRQAARRALEACLASGVFTHLHHRMALILQARSAADPGWPLWASSSAD